MSERGMLHQTIRQELYEMYVAGIDHATVPSKYGPVGDAELDEAVDRIATVLTRGPVLAKLAKHAYEQAVPPAVSEITGEPTWEEACQRQHSITAYITGDIADILAGEFGVDKYGRPVEVPTTT